jgi:16S rRNA (guanine1516-N2)-methyltransferase
MVPDVPLRIDFLSDKLLYRITQASLRKELLARAIGVHPRENPTIVDATAGLGRDSFILAALGYNVTLLERSPTLHNLLSDALLRAKTHPDIAPIIDRMHLIQADAIEWLPTQPPFNVIYLDPMFPERKKSASVKKEMIFLQNLIGKDTDSLPLFELAITCATHRVVVKRPRLAANISQNKPNFSLIGKSSRFDIYLGTNR